MVKKATIALAIIFCFGLTFGVAAQISFSGGGGGIVVKGSDSTSIYPLVFQLRDDDQWASARTTLVEQATEGRAVEVVYTLQKTKKQLSDEKVGGRIDAVLGDLEEAGLFPIQAEAAKAELAELLKSMQSLNAEKVKNQAIPAFVMALRSAEKDLARARVILETGEEPASPRRGGMRRSGRVIAVPTGEQ